MEPERNSTTVHLAARPGVAACGYAGKFTTTSPSAVTCDLCRESWTFAAAQRRSGARKGRRR